MDRIKNFFNKKLFKTIAAIVFIIIFSYFVAYICKPMENDQEFANNIYWPLVVSSIIVIITEQNYSNHSSNQNNESDNNTELFHLQAAKAITKPSIEVLGNNLADIVDGITCPAAFWGQKKKLKLQAEIDILKADLENGIKKIPEERMQELKMNIIGPALETFNYYFEESYYRKMISKLILASCDSEYDEIIHPAYVQIIRQLSPVDALVLNDLAKTEILTGITLEKDQNMYFAIPGSTIHEKGPEKCDIAISNLERLNIINITHGITVQHIVLDDENFNDCEFLIDPRFDATKAYFEKMGYSVSSNTMTLTTFGKNFLKICFDTKR